MLPTVVVRMEWVTEGDDLPGDGGALVRQLDFVILCGMPNGDRVNLNDDGG